MLTPEDYLGLWNSCLVTKDPKQLMEISAICQTAQENQSVYEQASAGSGVPWQVIAAIHFRESNQSFKCHLHNGDPLTARTVRVPIGRPLVGAPTFTWPESAIDALSLKMKPLVWDLARCLEFIERYNGTGYQKHSVNTPYLWDYTDKYSTGLYRSDGSFDPLKQEIRPGAVVILKGLCFNGVA